jgi:hypothetical protein
MEENPAPAPTMNRDERTFLEKLRLAAQVILDAAPDLDFISDPLESEAAILKDRVEFMLLLPEAAEDALPWRRVARDLRDQIRRDQGDGGGPLA